MSIPITPPRRSTSLLSYMEREWPDLFAEWQNITQDTPRDYRDSHYARRRPDDTGERTPRNRMDTRTEEP